MNFTKIKFKYEITCAWNLDELYEVWIYKFINFLKLHDCDILYGYSNDLQLAFTGDRKIVTHLWWNICTRCLNRDSDCASSLFESETLPWLNFPTNRTPVSKTIGFVISSPTKNLIYCSRVADNCIQQGSVLSGVSALYFMPTARRKLSELIRYSFWLYVICTLANLSKYLQGWEERDSLANRSNFSFTSIW